MSPTTESPKITAFALAVVESAEACGEETPFAVYEDDELLSCHATQEEAVAAMNATDTDAETAGTFVALLAPEGVMSADGRMFVEGSLDWRPLPITLLFQDTTDDNHNGARVAGVFTRIERRGTNIVASGDFYSNEAGSQLRAILTESDRFGLSVDVVATVGTVEVNEVDEDGLPVSSQYIIESGTIAAATAVAVPAFEEAFISLGSDLDGLDAGEPSKSEANEATPDELPPVEDEDEAPLSEAPKLSADTKAKASVDLALRKRESIIASAIPMQYACPMSWFEDPKLTEPTPFTVDDNGRVHMHVALWGSCHTGSPNRCVTPPSSASHYMHFHVGTWPTTDSGPAPVGTLTLGTSHAPLGMGMMAATSHYDDTGTAAAYGRCGEDKFGIWFAGLVAPNLPDDKKVALGAATPSGDWREKDGHLELVALLAVNTPGFPVLRTQSHIEDDECASLVAAAAPAGVSLAMTTMHGLEKRIATLEKTSRDDRLQALRDLKR